MKKRVIFLSLVIVVLIVLTGCMGINSRQFTLEQFKESLKDDYNIDIAEIYNESDRTSPLASSAIVNFEEMDESLANAIKDKLEKWCHYQGGYFVLYLKTTGGGYKAVYFIDIAFKHIEINGKKVYGTIKDYLYVTDTDFRW